MAREIKAIVELSKAQMQEFWANFNNSDNLKAAEEANRKSMKIRFHVL